MRVIAAAEHLEIHCARASLGQDGGSTSSSTAMNPSTAAFSTTTYEVHAYLLTSISMGNMHSEVQNLLNSLTMSRQDMAARIHCPQARSYSACSFWSGSKRMLCTCLIPGVCVMVERCAFLTRCTTISYCRRGTVAVAACTGQVSHSGTCRDI